MVYKPNILQQEMPFEGKLPTERLLDVSTMTDGQLHAKLEKGYADVAAGRTRPAKEALDEICRDYGL